MSVNRRQFLGAAAALPLAVSQSAAKAPPGKSLIEPFNYSGVRLLPSRWQQQFQSGRDYYLNVSNDDILHGYRAAAGLPAPGKPLGGWCARNSDPVFGQWLSGMARVHRATGDQPLLNKARQLLAGWAATVKNGEAKMSLYSYEKVVCGLVDLDEYGGEKNALDVLDRTMEWAIRTFSKERVAGHAALINGSPSEWYTFAENVYRAWEATGQRKYRDFADTYLYHAFWDKFATTPDPADAYHVHAYSHVNTFSSAAKAYEVTGDARYLTILRNAYDYLQSRQGYATGGYGPMERLTPPNGTLGRSLEARNATFEAVCGSWAGFKMCRYLQQFTGEARYGDWAERLFYNGMGAALPIRDDGKHFYYADYRVTGGMKVYKVSRYSCCSGSYFQNIADYHNLIYYRDASSLYVNLYVPSELTWTRPEGDVQVVQETGYPEAETSTLRVRTSAPMSFGLKFRVPEWAQGASVKVNGDAVEMRCSPGTWAEVTRTWQSGDAVEIRIPLALRAEAVDRQHPRRVAIVRGPVVLVMDDWVFETIPQLPDPKNIDKWLVADDRPGVFRLAMPDGSKQDARFRPFYAIGEVVPYRMYHDLDVPPIPVW
jgi:uncharacterized protein